VTVRSAIHDTFSIERTYAAEPARVFAAFTSAEAKEAWGDTGDLGEAQGEAAVSEFDFRPGGRERFGFVNQGTEYRYEALYYDIAEQQRILYAYEMYADGQRFSVSMVTIEFAGQGDGGTTLTWTEQGTYLDGIDGPEAPRLREGGVTEMLGNLTGYVEQGVQVR
jgi:uncharacterized protein YndB with AHSA1/START domain